MSESHDVIILGAGHNGLVTAFYLAKAGFKPLVLERRPVVGGCAITEEFHPGFRSSRLAHAAGPVRSDIVGDMELAKHGLKTYTPTIRALSLSHSGNLALLRRCREVAAGDREILAERRCELRRISAVAGAHWRSCRPADEHRRRPISMSPGPTTFGSC